MKSFLYNIAYILKIVFIQIISGILFQTLFNFLLVLHFEKNILLENYAGKPITFMR